MCVRVGHTSPCWSCMGWVGSSLGSGAGEGAGTEAVPAAELLPRRPE